MSAEQDRKFFDTFLAILGALVLFTVAIYVLANSVGAKTQRAWVEAEPAKQGLVEARLQPVGEVAMLGETATSVPEVPEPVEVQLTGAQVYNQACVICHASGAAGAPILGDASQWEDRMAKGIDTLNTHAIQGFNAMPAKGGYVNLSDQNVIDAVQFMVDALE